MDTSPLSSIPQLFGDVFSRELHGKSVFPSCFHTPAPRHLLVGSARPLEQESAGPGHNASLYQVPPAAQGDYGLDMQVQTFISICYFESSGFRPF